MSPLSRVLGASIPWPLSSNKSVSATQSHQILFSTFIGVPSLGLTSAITPVGSESNRTGSEAANATIAALRPLRRCDHPDP